MDGCSSRNISCGFGVCMWVRLSVQREAHSQFTDRKEIKLHSISYTSPSREGRKKKTGGRGFVCVSLSALSTNKANCHFPGLHLCTYLSLFLTKHGSLINIWERIDESFSKEKRMFWSVQQRSTLYASWFCLQNIHGDKSGKYEISSTMHPVTMSFP